MSINTPRERESGGTDKDSRLIDMASVDQVLSWEYILVVLSVRLLQRRPMWEKRSQPQKSHLCVVSGLLELLRSFLQALRLI